MEVVLLNGNSLLITRKNAINDSQNTWATKTGIIGLRDNALNTEECYGCRSVASSKNERLH